jgi:hypothetical protein
MIVLSETSTHKYLGVSVPRDARGFTKTQDGEIVYLHGQWSSNYLSVIHHPFESFLGVIGNGEEISEEAAGEIVNIYSPEQTVWMSGRYFRDVLILLLSEKGLLVENPIEKPQFSALERISPAMQSEIQSKINNYEYYESRLVKVVILKIKK